MKTKMPTRKMRKSSLLVPFLLFAVLAAAESKPKPYALIFGTVFNADQRAVAGVKVKIRRAADKKAKWELISDRRGEFAQRLPAEPMDYVVWADLKDRQAAHKTEVKVHIEKEERQDIALHLTE
jgi:hypothetical protein